MKVEFKRTVESIFTGLNIIHSKNAFTLAAVVAAAVGGGAVVAAAVVIVAVGGAV